MAELHLLGTTDDGRHLLLASTPGGPAEFRLAADARLAGALRAVARTAGSSSALSPRQIQAELRAGASVDDVAARAGVPVQRLEPYTAPVLSELARVLEDALAARMSRPQHGPSALPLGRAVRARLAPAGSEGPEPLWSARRAHDSGWVVELRYAGADGPAVARWRWDRVVHSLAPLDDVAAELGHVTPRGQLPAPDPTAPGVAPPPAAPAAENPADPGAPAARAGQPSVDRRGGETSRPVRTGRPGRRPAVPAWADVLLGVTSAAPAATPAATPAAAEDAEAAG